MDVIVKTLFWLLARLPLALARGLGKLTGRLNYVLKTQAARVTDANIQLCFPGLSDAQRDLLVLESLRHTGQMMFETPRAWMRSIEDNRRLIERVHNERLLETEVNSEAGVIVVLPHLGNWEMFNVYFASRGKMTALYAPPRKPYLRSLMAEIRTKYGNDMVPTTRKGIASLYRKLEAGSVVTILPDQVPGNGLVASFFGQDTLTDVLITRLVQKTGARVVCCFVERTEPGFEVHFIAPDPEVYSDDAARSVAAVNKSVESCVRNIPAQYQWEYKRFKLRSGGPPDLYKFG